MQRIGSRAQVMHGNAKMTGGGLRKKDLKYNKQGKIVSKKMSQRAKKEKRLQKAGYTTIKGQFGAVSMDGGESGRTRSGSRSLSGRRSSSKTRTRSRSRVPSSSRNSSLKSSCKNFKNQNSCTRGKGKGQIGKLTRGIYTHNCIWIQNECRKKTRERERERESERIEKIYRAIELQKSIINSVSYQELAKRILHILMGFRNNDTKEAKENKFLSFFDTNDESKKLKTNDESKKLKTNDESNKLKNLFNFMENKNIEINIKNLYTYNEPFTYETQLNKMMFFKNDHAKVYEFKVEQQIFSKILNSIDDNKNKFYKLCNLINIFNNCNYLIDQPTYINLINKDIIINFNYNDKSKADFIFDLPCYVRIFMSGDTNLFRFIKEIRQNMIDKYIIDNREIIDNGKDNYIVPLSIYNKRIARKSNSELNTYHLRKLFKNENNENNY